MKYFSNYLKILSLVLPMLLSAEGWNSIVTTSSTIDDISSECFFLSFAEMDQAVNSSGLHLVVADADGILYKRFNTSGTLQSSYTISTSGYYPNIVCDEDNLYVVYFSGSSLYVKKSVNNGSSWTSGGSISFGGYGCTGIDVAIDGDYLHVVYGKGDETYYYRNTGGLWYDYKHVSDGTSGGAPHIALSDNRIHVSWNTDPTPFYCDGSYSLTRDKVGTDWVGEQAVGWYLSTTSAGEDLVVVGDELHMLYFIPGGNNYPLYHTSRDVDDGVYDWSSEADVEDVDLVAGATLEIAGVTQNGTLHAIGGASGGLNHFTFNGTSWSTGTDIDGTNSGRWYSMATNSNDIYVFWATYGSPDYTIQYRQYDANPTAPQSISLSGGSGSNPVISWNANPEADLSTYRIYRNVVWSRFNQTGWEYQASTTSTSWTDSNFLVGGTIATAYYKVVARDVSSQDSPYSTTVSVNGAPGMAKNISSNEIIPTEFSLSQAYPNPFNPITTINYSLPLSSNVEIMTFDVRGQLVSQELIDNQQAGQYQYTWNGTDLSGLQVPSGIYIIKMRAVGVEEREEYSGASQLEGSQKVMLLK